MLFRTTRPKTAATVMAVLAAATAVSAGGVPKVKIVPLPADCTALPGYTASDGTAQNLFIYITDDDTNNGTKARTNVFLSEGNKPTGFVTFPYPGAGVSENAYQVKCGGGGVLSIFTNFTASPDQALQVAASPIAASLGFGLPGGVPVRLYAHQDPATGAALPGVFLGAQNTSTWGVAYAQYFSTDGSGLMMARLLGPNTPLQPGGQYLLPLETPVFLRLDA